MNNYPYLKMWSTLSTTLSINPYLTLTISKNYNMQPMHFAPPSGSFAYSNESMNVVHPIHDQVHSIDHQPFPEVSQPTAHVQPAAHPSPAVPPQKNFTAIKNRKPSLKNEKGAKETLLSP
ncbi:unnamed protein product [Lepeophtheirus salmonis]|uniref:(salmon louse) hypothetical protein n=1 Tax=Lepeophtheirus salmonis TaxID=72036 RepID=A0A7R8CEN6_LEPSM|nr:unnamed protein product [Lepeophtheirus salmonis]CAF2792704.1 unnamed protein product [Lepeophtheirus salmonis]